MATLPVSVLPAAEPGEGALARLTSRPMLVPPAAPRRGLFATLELLVGLVLAQGRSRLQYRFATFAWFIIQGSAYVAEYAAVMVLYALNVMSYGLSGYFFQGTMVRLEEVIFRGDLDHYLTKPVNPLLHMVGRTFNAGYTTHVVLSVSVLLAALRALDFEWSPGKLLYLLLAIAGAALIQSASWLGTGATAFWLTRTGNVQAFLLHDMREVVTFPVSIYGRGVQAALTFVLTWAFVNYYPVVFLLHRPAKPAEQVAGFFAPLVGVLTFLVAYWLWRRGLDSYQGGGA